MKSYHKRAEEFRNYNLADAGVTYFFCPEDLDEKTREKLEQEIDFDDDSDISLHSTDLCSMGIESYDLPDGESEWDKDDEIETLRTFIKQAPGYLVFLSGYRWNGSSGYRLARDITSIIRRDYDVTINPRSATPGGKTLVCTEYSHDVPMGSTTVCVALTEAEYWMLKFADFETVERFATKHREQAERQAERSAA